MKNLVILVISMACFGLNINAQIGMGTNNPDLSTELDIVSPNGNKGLLIPRVSLTADLTNPLPTTNPGVGLMVYNKGSAVQMGFYYWSGTSWYRFAAFAPGGGDYFQSAIQCYNTDIDECTSTTQVIIRWGGEDYIDPIVFTHDPLVSPREIYVNYAGVYEISANINLQLGSNSSAVQFMMRVLVDGAVIDRGKSYSSSKENGAKATMSPSPILVHLETGQSISISFNQQSSSPVSINTIPTECTISLKLIAAD